jgi:hypothetical protein
VVRGVGPSHEGSRGIFRLWSRTGGSRHGGGSLDAADWGSLSSPPRRRRRGRCGREIGLNVPTGGWTVRDRRWEAEALMRATRRPPRRRQQRWCRRVRQTRRRSMRCRCVSNRWSPLSVPLRWFSVPGPGICMSRGSKDRSCGFRSVVATRYRWLISAPRSPRVASRVCSIWPSTRRRWSPRGDVLYGSPWVADERYGSAFCTP